jgi:hypothetical protein
MYTNMEKKVTRKFKSGELHERLVVATWKPSQHLLVDTGKSRVALIDIK